MTKLSRRQFLETSAAAAAVSGTALTAACGDDGGDQPSFQYGVASGDPLADSVILWTRVSTSGASASGTWEVATDPAFTAPAATGTFTTDADRDFTVKVEATGLTAGTTYYYRFRAGDAVSPIGRTKTLPSGSVSRLRFAFVSCSNYPAGYFHGYRGIAERADLDAVLHLGDYTYEYDNASYGDGTTLGRVVAPDAETVTLADYRARLATYRSDPDLQDAHRQHPFIVIWDDHETTNNSWTGGAENHTPGEEGDWEARKAAALQAYYEWLPIREPASGDRAEAYRAFTYGDLVELVMIETRLVGREEQTEDPAVAAAAGRQLLGAAQEAWLLGRLRNATATWKIIGNQTIFTHFDAGTNESSFYDQWQGYKDARARVLEAIDTGGVDNVVVLTGDVHSSWAGEVPLDPGATPPRSVAVEFVSPSVTSQSLGEAVAELFGEALVEPLRLSLLATNPHIKWSDVRQHGYVLLDVTPTAAQADWWFVGDVRSEVFSEQWGTGWRVAAGTSTLTEATAPVADGDGDPLAP